MLSAFDFKFFKFAVWFGMTAATDGRHYGSPRDARRPPEEVPGSFLPGALKQTGESGALPFALKIRPEK